jgi:hypothetical protein
MAIFSCGSCSVGVVGVATLVRTAMIEVLPEKICVRGLSPFWLLFDQNGMPMATYFRKINDFSHFASCEAGLRYRGSDFQSDR